MKTTIDLPDELLIEAKKRAAEQRTSLKELVTQGLRRELAVDQPASQNPGAPTIEWVVVNGGLPPELDIVDRAQMHEWIRTER